MKTNKNIMALFVFAAHMVPYTVAFAESGDIKQNTTLKPGIKTPVLMPVSPNSFIVPSSVKEKPKEAVLTQTKKNSLQKNKVTSIRSKPNKAIARQIKPLTVKQPSNVSGASQIAPSHGGVANVPAADRLNHANQARDIKEAAEVTKNGMGVLDQQNPLDSNLGLGSNDSNGYNFGGRRGDNENSDNGPVKAPIGPSSVRGSAEGAASNHSYRLPSSGVPVQSSSRTLADGSRVESSSWTTEGGTHIDQRDTFYSDGTSSQTIDLRMTNGNTMHRETNYNRSGRGNARTIWYDRNGNVASDESRPVTSPVDGSSSSHKGGASKVDSPKVADTSPKLDSQPDLNSDAGSEKWDDFVESINGIKKDTSVKNPTYVNPGNQEETGTNSAPKATLFIPKNKLVTNPDPDNARGQDAVSGRRMSEQEMMEGSTPGGHMGRDQ